MANDVTLLIKLQDQASRKLAKITGNTKKLERANNSAQNSIRRINRGIKDTGRAADKAAKGVGTLGKAVRGLVAGFGAFQAGKFVIFKTAELERQTKSLEVLTGSLGNARTIIKELQQFGAVTPFSSSELIETAKRLKAFGVETESVVDVTKRLADVAGATGADLGGIATAFGQIQAKGRLQGEELLQLQERGVNLQEQLRKQYGLTADEFQKALEQGRFGADAVRFALVELTEEGGKYAGGAIAQSETLAGKFSTLIDNVERLATKIGQKLQPILRFVLDTSIAIVDAINKALAGPDYATATARLTTVVEQIEKAKTNIKNLEAAGVTLTTPGLQIRDIEGNVIPQSTVSPLAAEQGILAKLQGERKFLEGRIAELEKSFLKVDEPTKRKPGDPPKLRDPRSSAQTALTTQQLAQQAGEKRLQTLRDQATIVAGITEEERRMLELEVAIEGIERQRVLLGDELANKLIAAEKNLVGQTVLAKQLKEEEKEQIAIADRLSKEMQRQVQFAEQIGQAIQSGLVQGIQDAITGSKSLGESLSGILNSVGGMFLSKGIGSFGKDGKKGSGLLGLLPFASGGFVDEPTRAVIGEGGESEYVIPSSKMNEAMGRYARGARGSAVIPDGSGGDASGGMTGGGGSIDVSYSVERINNVNYVTAAEFERGMAQAAKRGAELGRRNVYSDLVNKRSVRSRVGV